MSLNTYERKSGIDTNNVDIVGGNQPVNLAQAAATGFALSDAQGIEIDTSPVIDHRAMDEEVFMREWLEIHMHDPANEDEPLYAEARVNGDYCMVVRGETKLVRRYHVAAFAQAKQLRLAQTKITNPDGSMGYSERAVLRPTYPFSVTHEPNKRGSAWLKQMLGNPA